MIRRWLGSFVALNPTPGETLTAFVFVAATSGALCAYFLAVTVVGDPLPRAVGSLIALAIGVLNLSAYQLVCHDYNLRAAARRRP